MMTELDYARVQISTLIATNELSLPVVDDNGETNVVVALADERLTELNKRLSRVNGYANLFVKDGRNITLVSVVNSECALSTDPEPVEIPDSSDSTVGNLLSYIAQAKRPVGIKSFAQEKPFARAEERESFVTA